MVSKAAEVGSEFRLECAVGIDRGGPTLLIKQKILATVHVEAR